MKKKMTKNEFRIHLKSKLEGEYRATLHIVRLCKIIMEDNRIAIKKQEIERRINMTPHLWR